MLRVAAASVSAVVISMGAVGPVYAAGNGGSGQAHASQAKQSAHQSQGRSAGHSQAAAARAKAKGQSGGAAQDKDGDSEASSAETQEAPATASESHRSGATAARSSAEEKSGAASSQGNGHTPVTVCHLLGNGGYHLLTFDQHALRAHLAHGDVYPDSTGACPSTPTTADAATTQSHGHTAITVCHVLGNGGYHLLTFDQHALKAHLAHGDVYPTAGGCPVPGSTTGGTNTTLTTRTTTIESGSSLAGESVTTPQLLGTESARAPRVLGVEAFRAGAANSVPGAATSGTPAQIAPAAGLLPNTGAARIGLPLVAGLGLLAAGAGLLARRRGASRG
jgi:LPXTG-motif cell wall-anchored protein